MNGGPERGVEMVEVEAEEEEEGGSSEGGIGERGNKIDKILNTEIEEQGVEWKIRRKRRKMRKKRKEEREEQLK